MTREIKYYEVSAICQGGPLDGAPIKIPHVAAAGALRGARVSIVLDETAHVYTLTPIDDYPFQVYRYEENAVQLPPLELPDGLE